MGSLINGLNPGCVKRGKILFYFPDPALKLYERHVSVLCHPRKNMNNKNFNKTLKAMHPLWESHASKIHYTEE